MGKDIKSTICHRKRLRDRALAPDPVLDAYREHIDFSLVKQNLMLTVSERATQLQKMAEFLNRWRPIVQSASNK